MLIWFFDSGLGGQVVMDIFQKEYPDIPMILEMDRENAPYWEKTGEEIRELTKRWVQKLFDRGADVVILACNTASVHALRWMQQEVFVWMHILGVTVPWAEAVVEWWYQKIGVLATAATVRTRMYKERVHFLDESVIVEEVWATGLVTLIEQGIISWKEIDILLQEYFSHFSPDIEALILGCTHYPLILGSMEKIWVQLHHKKLPDIIDPGEASVKKFRSWMERKVY